MISRFSCSTCKAFQKHGVPNTITLRACWSITRPCEILVAVDIATPYNPINTKNEGNFSIPLFVIQGGNRPQLRVRLTMLLLCLVYVVLMFVLLLVALVDNFSEGPYPESSCHREGSDHVTVADAGLHAILREWWIGLHGWQELGWFLRHSTIDGERIACMPYNNAWSVCTSYFTIACIYWINDATFEAFAV